MFAGGRAQLLKTCKSSCASRRLLHASSAKASLERWRVGLGAKQRLQPCGSLAAGQMSEAHTDAGAADVAAAERTRPLRRRAAIVPPPPEQRRDAKRARGLCTADSQAPANADLCVLMNGSSGFNRCLALHTNSGDYLFNCPEQVQRLAHDRIHPVRMSEMRHIFFTSGGWPNVAGLPGYALSARSTGVRLLTLHGAPHVERVLSAVRPFYDEMLNVDFVESSYELGHFQDKAVDVQYVPLFSSSRAAVPATAGAVEGPSVAVAFIVRLQQRPAKIDVEKCIRLGVAPGPHVGQLQRGETVTLASGAVVEPAAVLAEAAEQRAPCFVVVECPDASFVAPLVDCAQLRHLSVDVVVHLSSAAIYQTETYQQWKDSFAAGTTHMVLNELAPYHPHFEGVFRLNQSLNSVHAGLYPCLGGVPSTFDCDGANGSKQDGDTVFMAPFERLHLRPPPQRLVRFAESFTGPQFRRNVILEQLDKLPNHSDRMTQVRQRLDSVKSDCTQDYPEVTFLGTSSSCPTKVRNVSSILVRLDESQYALFDCGEGTYVQLLHWFGEAGMVDFLTKLKLVFISHGHLDHHLGLISVIRRRMAAFKSCGLPYDPFFLIAPGHVYQVHNLITRTIEELGVYARRIMAEKANPLLDEAAAALGLRSLAVCPVDHPMQPHAIIVRLADGFKLVYSGDTRPCDTLVADGAGADLLIHEATFGDDYADHALLKRHSTCSEAIDVGRRMGARMTLLTHLSARYSYIPLIDDEVLAECGERVYYANDFLHVTPRHLHILPIVRPALHTLFQEQLRDSEIDAQRIRARFQHDEGLDAQQQVPPRSAAVGS